MESRKDKGQIKRGSSRATSHELEEHIVRIGRGLCESLQAVLAAVPGAPQRPTELINALGINKVLASRVLQASRQLDPLAATHMMPGPEALRSLLKAASKQKVAKSLIKTAETAVQDFEEFVRDDLGGRAELDALLSAWLPDARERFEMSNKQLAFKGICGLRGVMAETHLTSVVIYPSEDATRCDGLFIHGLYGLRRIRPEVLIRFSTQFTMPEPPDYEWTTLDGTPIESMKANIVVPQFCSQPPPEVEIRRAGSTVHYVVAGDGIGPKSAVNIFGVEVFRRHLERYREIASSYRRSASAEVQTPTETLVLDMLLHEAVWPDSTPELMVYDTTVRGVANGNDRSRDIDRLDLAESIQPLGWGAAKFRVAGVPEYVELLRYTCDKLGWDGDKLRGYRCRVRYPLYGSQVLMAFELPAK